MFTKIKEFFTGLKERLFWQTFPGHVPIDKGWYMCTIEVSRQQRYVMNLYWYPERARFIDNIRQNIFDTYEVYGWSDIAPDHKQRLFTINLCDRTNEVVAWKKEPNPFMKASIEVDTREWRDIDE